MFTAIPIYWVLVLAAGKKGKGYISFLFRLIEGFLLAHICFVFLPMAFLGSLGGGVGGALVGIILGVWLENGLYSLSGRKEFPAAIFFTLLFFSGNSFLEGIAGGLALYGAGSMLLAEGMGNREKIHAALGGTLGFLLGSVVNFF